MTLAVRLQLGFLALAASLAAGSTGALAQDSAAAASPAQDAPASSGTPESDSATAANRPQPAEAQPAPADTIAVEELRKEGQQAPPPDTADDAHNRLESVVVTANKRQQLLQDVPMSITAVRGKDLEKNGAKTFTDYANTVPALNYGSYGEGRSRINIRGLQAPTGVAVVSYLVDGISQSNSPPDSELFDIDRIEILRGPQGTLYGEGAVGGAIKIITNGADPNALLSKGQASYNQNAAGAMSHDVNGMVNVPLINGELGLRLVGFARHADGYITEREPDFNNPPGFKSYSSKNIVATKSNPNDVTGGRMALDWKPSQTLAVSAKYNTQKSNAGTGPGESPALEQRYGPYNVTQGVNPVVGDFTRHNYTQASINVGWQAPWLTIESVTGVADVKEDVGIPFLVVLPLAGTAAGAVGLTLPVNPALPPTLSQPAEDAGLPVSGSVADMFDIRLINQTSYIVQELRFLSLPDSGPWTWTTGVFLKIEDREAFEDLFAGPNLSPALGHLYDQVNLHFYTKEYAAYGQVEYAFNEKFSLLGGARYYHANIIDTASGGGTDGTIFPRTFSDVSPKVTLSYHANDHVLLYTTAAKGFRAGGVNFSTVKPPPPNGNRYYDPDVLWSYEIGINSVLLDGRVTANAAAFTSNWKNLQNEIRLHSNGSVGPGGFDPGGNERYVINAGAAYSRGVEFEVTSLLPAHLTWTVNGAYLDAAIGQDLPNPALDGAVIPKGTPLENVPHLAGSTTLTHEYRASGGWGLSSALVWTYRGSSHGDILNPRGSVSKGYQLVNARVGLKGRNDTWATDLYVNNLFNEQASSFTFQTLDTVLPLARRTVGARVSFNF